MMIVHNMYSSSSKRSVRSRGILNNWHLSELSPQNKHLVGFTFGQCHEDDDDDDDDDGDDVYHWVLGLSDHCYYCTEMVKGLMVMVCWWSYMTMMMMIFLTMMMIFEAFTFLKSQSIGLSLLNTPLDLFEVSARKLIRCKISHLSGIRTTWALCFSGTYTWYRCLYQVYLCIQCTKCLYQVNVPVNVAVNVAGG